MNGIAIGMIGAPQPIEVDVKVEQKNELIDLLYSGLSRHISDCWERAKFSKTEITERLLQCERQRRRRRCPPHYARQGVPHGPGAVR